MSHTSEDCACVGWFSSKELIEMANSKIEFSRFYIVEFWTKMCPQHTKIKSIPIKSYPQNYYVSGTFFFMLTQNTINKSIQHKY